MARPVLGLTDADMFLWTMRCGYTNVVLRAERGSELGQLTPRARHRDPTRRGMGERLDPWYLSNVKAARVSIGPYGGPPRLRTSDSHPGKIGPRRPEGVRDYQDMPILLDLAC